MFLKPSDQAKAWENTVRDLCQGNVDPGAPFFEPIMMRLTFYFPRPAKHFKGNNRSRELREGADWYQAGRPDIDKLCRAVLDGLTGVVFYDDKQVVELHALKRYCDEVVVERGAEPGAKIEAWVLEEDDEP